MPMQLCPVYYVGDISEMLGYVGTPEPEPFEYSGIFREPLQYSAALTTLPRSD